MSDGREDELCLEAQDAVPDKGAQEMLVLRGQLESMVTQS